MMQKPNSLLGAQYRVCGLTPRFLQRTKKKRDFLRLLIEVAVVGFSSSELGEIEPTAVVVAVFASSAVLGKRSPWLRCIGPEVSGLEQVRHLLQCSLASREVVEEFT